MVVEIKVIIWEFLDNLDCWYHSENMQPKNIKNLQLLDKTLRHEYYLEVEGMMNTIWRKHRDAFRELDEVKDE